MASSMKRRIGAVCSAVVGVLLLVMLGSLWHPLTRAEAAAQEIPLLDRALFSGDPSYASAQISPSGSYLAFLKPYRGLLTIWVKKIEAPFSEAYPVVETARPIRWYTWSRDGAYLLFTRDQGGNENFHLFSVDPLQDAAQHERDLTPYDNVRAELLCLPKQRPGIAYVGINDRDERYHDVYQIDLSTGNRSLIQLNDHAIADWVFDRSGTLRLGVYAAPDGTTNIVTVGHREPSLLCSCSKEEILQPLAFHPDGKRLYVATNKGDDVDLSRLMLLDTETGTEEWVESDPEGEVDFEAPLFSPVTDELVATLYIGDRQRLYFKDSEWERDFRHMSSMLPDGDVDLSSLTSDGMIWVVCVRSDTVPETAYLYNRKTHTLSFLYKARHDLPSEYLSLMRPIVYTARDGLSIHGYLTTPRGALPQRLPLVVLPHGGPWARDVWGYDRTVQLLANRGYAVLQMNFRGSTGYGKAFLNAGNKQWGDAMQNDITDGVLYCVKQGIADPQRVAIYGGSYGGYATLAGLAFTPSLYAAGISYVGPSNLITLLDSFPAYWETGRSYMNERVGDTKNPEDLPRLRKQSPLFSADRITAPLLVVQGANDPRVKKAESDQIVKALCALGRHVEYICAPDEGHGFARVENRTALAVAAEKFLAQHLGGRYQKEVPEAIEQRLREITVDVNELAETVSGQPVLQ